MIAGFLVGSLISAALLEEDTSYIIMYLNWKKKTFKTIIRHSRCKVFQLKFACASINLAVQLVGADAKPCSRRLRLSVGGGICGKQVQSPDGVNVEVLLQLQRSFQDTDGVARLLFQLQTSAGRTNETVVMLEIVRAEELDFISDLCERTPLTTPRMFSVISFSCCKTLNLWWTQINRSK